MGAKKPLALQKGHLTKKQRLEKELEEQHQSSMGAEHLNDMIPIKDTYILSTN